MFKIGSYHTIAYIFQNIHNKEFQNKGNLLNILQVSIYIISRIKKSSVVAQIYLDHKKDRAEVSYLKSDNLQYNMLGRWVDLLIDQAFDGPSIILIDWK